MIFKISFFLLFKISVSPLWSLSLCLSLSNLRLNCYSYYSFLSYYSYYVTIVTIVTLTKKYVLI